MQKANRAARIETRIAAEVLAVARRIIQVSAEDQRAFAEVILNPPAPNDALLRAAKAYASLIKPDAQYRFTIYTIRC